jgi:hypothetical protein
MQTKTTTDSSNRGVVGSLVLVKKWGEKFFVGIYLGPSRKFDASKPPYAWRFLTIDLSIVDVDLGNNLCYESEWIL